MVKYHENLLALQRKPGQMLHQSGSNPVGADTWVCPTLGTGQATQHKFPHGRDRGEPMCSPLRNFQNLITQNDQECSGRFGLGWLIDWKSPNFKYSDQGTLN